MTASSLSRNDALLEWLRVHAPDCGDNSCLFGGRGKGGMRTNGGCRCFKDLPTAKRIYIERLASAVLSETARTFADTDLADRNATEQLVDRASQAATEAFAAQSSDKNDAQPPRPLTNAEKSMAFEWLREYALSTKEGARHAYVAIVEWHALKSAQSATPQPVRELLIEARAWLDVAADSGISSRDEMNLPTPNAERCHNLSTRIYNALMGIVRDSDRTA